MRTDAVAEGVGRAERAHDDKAPDARSPFQRDRDRLLYSAGFRRLAGITQVASAAEGHVYHNRLTHTLKVAQVARRLAENLLGDADKLIAAGDVPASSRPAIDADVAESAALAHDLGHPPFGHVGEEELQERLKGIAPADSFEGNAQSFRIVTKIALMDPAFQGLNLTRATLNATLKYPWLYSLGPTPKSTKKWSAYTHEAEDFCFARGLAMTEAPVAGVAEAPPEGQSGAGFEQSLEAFIMDWADDITYAVHDAEDHYRAGLVPLDQLANDEVAVSDFASWVHERWIQRGGDSPGQLQIAGALKPLLYLFGSSAPYVGDAKQRMTLRFFTSVLIARYVRATSIAIDDQGRWRVSVTPSARLEVEVLKEMTWRYVIERPALATQQYGQRKVLGAVFDTFFEASGSRQLSILPRRVQDSVRSLKAAGVLTPPARGQVVVDALCSMTEDELLRLHGRLSGRTPGSLRDIIA